MRTRIQSTSFLLEEHGVVSVGALGFENNYAIVMRGEHARGLGIRTIADLSGRDFDIAGDPEVFGRPEWERVRDIYGLQSLATRPMQTIYTWDALHEGQVDASIAYTTDGRIAEGDLVILDDNRQAFPPYDAILLVSPEASRNRALLEVLSGLVNRIDDSTMRVANRLVEIDRESPQQAARWLWEKTRPEAAEEEPAVP